MHAGSSSVCPQDRRFSNFKITPATEAILAYFNTLLFPSQVKFSSIRTQITSKQCDFLPNQNCILPPCSQKENAEKTPLLTTRPFFLGGGEGGMSQPKEAQVTCIVSCFHDLFKRIFRSCKPTDPFFDQKESISK